jgi:GNAT superfamily N-acetyltransferase
MRAGVGALRMLSDEIAEIKRIYVAPDWRDRHLGSAILDRLVEEARSRSQTELRGSRHGPERLVDGRKVLVALTEFDRPAQTFVQHSRK